MATSVGRILTRSTIPCKCGSKSICVSAATYRKLSLKLSITLLGAECYTILGSENLETVLSSGFGIIRLL